MRIIAMLGEIAVNDIKLKISDNIPPPDVIKDFIKRLRGI
jgi:hypothetical protein